MASCDPMNQTIPCLKNGYIHVPTRSSTVDLNKYLTILTVPTKTAHGSQSLPATERGRGKQDLTGSLRQLRAQCTTILLAYASDLTN